MSYKLQSYRKVKECTHMEVILEEMLHTQIQKCKGSELNKE